MRNILFISVFTITTLVVNAQKKIQLYYDTAQMRKEILSHIPVGTDIETAKEIMKKNHFKIEVMKMGDASYRQEFVKVPLDYIFCRRNKSGLSLIEKSWAVAIIYKENKVVDVKNELWLTGP